MNIAVYPEAPFLMARMSMQGRAQDATVHVTLTNVLSPSAGDDNEFAWR
jgi:hypothetical protein